MDDREINSPADRTKYLASLNSSAIHLDKKRVQDCKDAIWDAYHSASVLPSVSLVRPDASISLDCRHRSIGVRGFITVAEFNDPSYHWGGYFSDVGRAVAFGEGKFLQDQITGHIKPHQEIISKSNPDYSILVGGLNLLTQTGIAPNTLLAPIDMFVSFVQAFEKELDWTSRPEVLTVRTNKMRVFWSSAYNPLDCFIAFDSAAGIWHVVADGETGRRVTIALGESSSKIGQVEYWVETLVAYEIVNPSSFVVVQTRNQTNACTNPEG